MVHGASRNLHSLTGTNYFNRPAGIGTEAAVWLTKVNDAIDRVIPPILYLLKDN